MAQNIPLTWCPYLMQARSSMSIISHTDILKGSLLAGTLTGVTKLKTSAEVNPLALQGNMEMFAIFPYKLIHVTSVVSCDL